MPEEHVDELNTLSWNITINDPREGLTLCRRAYEEAEKLDYKTGMAESLLNEGWCCIYQSDNKRALEVLDKSLKFYEQLNDDKGKIRVLNALGVVYQSLNQYDRAMNLYSRCLDMSKDIGDMERLSAALGNIGSLYQELGKDKEALEYFEQILELMEDTGLEEQKCNILADMGVSYRNLQNRETAMFCFHESLEIARKIDDRISEAKCLIAMGVIFQELEKPDDAERFLTDGLDISRKTGDRSAEVEVLTSLGKYYLQQRKYEKSLEYLERALVLCKIIKSKRFEYKIYHVISDLYSEQDNYRSALESYRNFYRVKSDLEDEKTEKKLKHITIQYEVEKNQREAEIYRLRNEELKESFNLINIISRIGQEITASLDMKTILSTISERIKTLMEADLFGIALYDDERREIEYKVFLEGETLMPGLKISLDSRTSLAAWCIRNRKPVFDNNIVENFQKYVPEGGLKLGDSEIDTNSLIYMLLKMEERIIGVITVQSYNKDVYTEQHLEILRALGSYMAIALENSQIHEEINELNNLVVEEKKEIEEANRQIVKLANHDNLTGLPNRRLFFELLRKDIAQAARQRHQIALFFIDLDNFKPVNDMLGHDAGDALLQIVARKFLKMLRSSDTIARIGGDEFIAIIPGLQDLEGVGEVANKLIGQLVSPIKVFETEFVIGASIGISIYPDDDLTIEGLLKKADTAMYNVKQERKNDYQFYSECDNQ